MQFKLSQGSLFAILLRSPWWASLLAAFAAFLLARTLLPEHLAPYGAISALPFVVITVMAAYKQLRVMSPARVSATLEAAITAITTKGRALIAPWAPMLRQGTGAWRDQRPALRGNRGDGASSVAATRDGLITRNCL